MFGPNIPGKLYGARRIDNQEEGSGALNWSGLSRPAPQTTNEQVYADIILDASKASSTYGRSTTVQPKSLRNLLLIRF